MSGQARCVSGEITVKPRCPPPPAASSPPVLLCIPLPVPLPFHIPSVFEMGKASPLSLPIPKGLLSLFHDLPILTSVTPLLIFNNRDSGTLKIFRPSKCWRLAEWAIHVSPGPVDSAVAPRDFSARSSLPHLLRLIGPWLTYPHAMTTFPPSSAFRISVSWMIFHPRWVRWACSDMHAIFFLLPLFLISCTPHVGDANPQLNMPCSVLCCSFSTSEIPAKGTRLSLGRALPFNTLLNISLGSL